ncbi:PilN domain-containing protein [Alcanivorax quisquiliarum]|uniref:PilN domain-containing protein n=1 Tax=Alcanivorax quisquiliarum TaxID=2933565 RepID=A0ABT0E5S8_9GAMM|nr:PilN domain-containing protein [Alcanivorax quisquiliarum]MCK0537187.1 PilN domain-containing protein [Alcanivorax quisquiliarum]
MRTTTINLLPWREARRKKRQQEFAMLLILAAILGGLIWFVWQGAVQGSVNSQSIRNQHIQKQIAELNQQIREIDELEQRRSELVERMRVIQELQGTRPTIVYVFDELVRTLPDGVYYTSVKRAGDLYTINGVAESNNRISRLMRNLGDSVWFGEPTLISVMAVDSTSQANRFVLTVSQSAPKAEGDEKQ